MMSQYNNEMTPIKKTIDQYKVVKIFFIFGKKSTNQTFYYISIKFVMVL